MRQIYSETPDFANLTSYVADYQSPFFQKSKTAENGRNHSQSISDDIEVGPNPAGLMRISLIILTHRSTINTAHAIKADDVSCFSCRMAIAIPY
jgi:hypothetical protein